MIWALVHQCCHAAVIEAGGIFQLSPPGVAATEPGLLRLDSEPCDTAFLLYRIEHREPGSEPSLLLVIEHTYAPTQCRGQGLAAKLCDAAVQRAASMQARIVPECSYVEDTYIQRREAAGRDVSMFLSLAQYDTLQDRCS